MSVSKRPMAALGNTGNNKVGPLVETTNRPKEMKVLRLPVAGGGCKVHGHGRLVRWAWVWPLMVVEPQVATQARFQLV
jgi:hypothetical protein